MIVNTSGCPYANSPGRALLFGGVGETMSNCSPRKRMARTGTHHAAARRFHDRLLSSSKRCGWARPAPGVACSAASGVALQVRRRTVRLLCGGDQGRSSEWVSGRCLAGVVVWLLDKLVTGGEAGELGGYRKRMNRPEFPGDLTQANPNDN